MCLPHWSVCGSGVWLGLTRWKRLCCSLHVRRHRASLPCASASVSSGSPVWNKPLNSLQTAQREKQNPQVSRTDCFVWDRPSLLQRVVLNQPTYWSFCKQKPQNRCSRAAFLLTAAVPDGISCNAYRAFVWLLSRVSAHVHHQHVLSFKGFLLSRTFFPATHKLLLFSVDVVIVYVL